MNYFYLEWVLNAKANAEALGEFRCHWCRRRQLPQELTIDHVIPRSFGGGDDVKNIVLACDACNQARNVAFQIQTTGRYCTYKQLKHLKHYFIYVNDCPFVQTFGLADLKRAFKEKAGKVRQKKWGEWYKKFFREELKG